MAPHSSTLAWKIHGQRSLVGCSPWGHEESDTTKWLHFYFSLSCIGEGNGNPLQYSCLENPRDGGAWWAAVYGVAQSRTRLKRLSSSSSSSSIHFEIFLQFLDVVFYFLFSSCFLFIFQSWSYQLTYLQAHWFFSCFQSTSKPIKSMLHFCYSVCDFQQFPLILS